MKDDEEDEALHTHEADVDHCVHDLDLADDEVTPDDQLPPASGGVAAVA